MTLLITGAAGFLGSNLLVQMAAAHPQARIVAADVFWTRSPSACNTQPSQVEYRVLDVRDHAACNSLMLQVRPTHMLHAAAVTQGPADLIFAVNVEGTANVLKAAHAAGSVERGIILSSSAVYCQQSGKPFCDEDDPLDLTHPYASAKRQAELQLEHSGFLAARLAPLYGPYEQQSASRPQVSLVQCLLDAWREDREITVTGDDMHRDWTHASDAARALDTLLFAETLRSTIYNVSAGVSVAGRTILRIFADRGLRMRAVSDRAEAEIIIDLGASRTPLCCARLHQDTAFVAKFDIAAGIADLIYAQERNL